MDVSKNSSIVTLKKLLPLLILAMLPLLLWALTTKRFEIRKKAASGEMPLANAVHWKTSSAALDADNFYIRLNTSQPFDARVMNTEPYGVHRNNQILSSEAITDASPFNTTLVATWTEGNPGTAPVPMMLLIYLKSNGIRWWSEEIRTYNGMTNGNQQPFVVYKPGNGEKFFESPVGRPYVGNLILTSTEFGRGMITFTNLKLMPFFEGKCWSDVLGGGDAPYAWPNGCKGVYTGQACSSNTVRLTEPIEREAYQGWRFGGQPSLSTCKPCTVFPALSGCTSGENCPFIPPPPSGDNFYCKPDPSLLPKACIPLPACVNPITPDAPRCDPAPLPAGQRYCPVTTPTACTPLPACAYQTNTIEKGTESVNRPICKIGATPPNGGVWCPRTPQTCTYPPAGCQDANGNLTCKIGIKGPLCPPEPVSSCQGQYNGAKCYSANCGPDRCRTLENGKQICEKRACVSALGTCNNYVCSIGAKVTPTPPVGCRYVTKQVQCIKAPCEPIQELVCDNSCVGQPNGSVCSLGGCEPCPPGKVCPMMCKQRLGSCSNQQCISAPTPTPTCVPQPKCATEGILGSDGNRVWCAVDQKPGVIYCPQPTPVTDMSCAGAKDGSSCVLPGCANTCAPGKVCTDVCRIKYGTCSTQKCIDGPTPTPPVGCTYRQVQCFKAPCEPILDCRITPTNVPAPSVTPPVGCTYQPIKLCVYQGSCSITAWNLRCTPTPTPPASQTVSITFKYAGVADDRAKNSKVKVRIVTPTSDVSTQALPVTYNATNKAYTVSFTNNKPLVAGSLYRFIIKGEKHVGSAICYQVGQTGACKSTDWITVSGISYNYGVDYTARPLVPGDVSPQDNILNQSDFDRLKVLLTKSSAALTDADKMICDLNYDGTCNTLDALLMRQSLETRPDEN